MKLKRFFFGEKMPDMDSPDRQEKRERRQAAGKKFAKVTRIDKLCGYLQKFANNHAKLFFTVILLIICSLLALNITRLHKAFNAQLQSKGEAEQVIQSPTSEMTDTTDVDSSKL